MEFDPESGMYVHTDPATGELIYVPAGEPDFDDSLLGVPQPAESPQEDIGTMPPMHTRASSDELLQQSHNLLQNAQSPLGLAPTEAPGQTPPEQLAGQQPPYVPPPVAPELAGAPGALPPDDAALLEQSFAQQQGLAAPEQELLDPYGPPTIDAPGAPGAVIDAYDALTPAEKFIVDETEAKQREQDDVAAALEERNIEHAKERERISAEMEQLSEIKPWADRVGTGKRIAAVIGGALGGFLAVTTGSGRNMFMESLERTIESDMQIQEKNLEKRFAELKYQGETNMLTIEDNYQLAAKKATLRGAAWWAAKKELDIQAQNATTVQQARDAAMKSAELEAKINKEMALAQKANSERLKIEKETELMRAKGGGGGSGGGNKLTQSGDYTVDKDGVLDATDTAYLWNPTDKEGYDATPESREEYVAYGKRSGDKGPVQMPELRVKVYDRKRKKHYWTNQALMSTADAKIASEAYVGAQNVSDAAQLAVSRIKNLEEVEGGSVLNKTVHKLTAAGSDARAAVEQAMDALTLIAKSEGVYNMGSALTKEEKDPLYNAVFGRNKDKVFSDMKLGSIIKSLQRWERDMHRIGKAKIAHKFGVKRDAVKFDFQTTSVAEEDTYDDAAKVVSKAHTSDEFFGKIDEFLVPVVTDAPTNLENDAVIESRMEQLEAYLEDQLKAAQAGYRAKGASGLQEETGGVANPIDEYINNIDRILRDSSESGIRTGPAGDEKAGWQILPDETAMLRRFRDSAADYVSQKETDKRKAKAKKNIREQSRSTQEAYSPKL